MNKSQQSNLLLKVIQACRDSVVVTDARLPDNPIIFANPAFERLTGYPSSEIEGRNCRFLQGLDLDQSPRRRIRGAVLIGLESQEVLRNYRKDGTLFYNELSISPVYDSKGSVRYFIGVQREVSEPVHAAG
jgi:PAS domain S-box-containing protein